MNLTERIGYDAGATRLEDALSAAGRHGFHYVDFCDVVDAYLQANTNSIALLVYSVNLACQQLGAKSIISAH